MSLRISAVTQGWLILAVVLCGMYSLAPSWRVILQMFQSSSVVAVSFDSAMVELMFTSFRLVQFALALTGTSYWACFFLVVLMMNSQYGMLWSERPGMTSVLEMSCGQFVVQIQGVILSSGFPYQLIKSWWRPGLGAVDLRVGVVDYQSHPGKLKSLPMRRWALESSLKWLSRFSQTGFISNAGPVVGTQ